jgi:hypothetical protein
MKRSSLVEGYGIPLGRVLAPANRHDSPLLALRWTSSMTWGRCPMTSESIWTPGTTRRKTREELAGRSMTWDIAHKGDKAPIQAGQR